MQPVCWILALWTAFAASHILLSSLRVRPRLVAALGEGPFTGLYSLLALAIFVPLVWLYFTHRHAGPHLWYLGPGPVLRSVVYLGMATAFALVVGGLFQQSPAALGGGKAEVRGVLHVTRHPVFMGAGIFGAVHLLGANVNAAELVFFAGFPIFAVVGCAHQDRRKRASLGEPYVRFCAETSLLPFGRGGLGAALRQAWLPIGIGVLAALALRSVHPQWLGGAP